MSHGQPISGVGRPVFKRLRKQKLRFDIFLLETIGKRSNLRNRVRKDFSKLRHFLKTLFESILLQITCEIFLPTVTTCYCMASVNRDIEFLFVLVFTKLHNLLTDQPAVAKCNIWYCNIIQICFEICSKTTFHTAYAPSYFVVINIFKLKF